MTFDLAPDVVELAPWTPAADAAPLREVRFRSDAWLPEEVETLRRMFADDTPIDAIADALGRRRAGVADRICQLGLRRNSTLPWTELDDEALGRRYGHEAAATIAQDLGRAVTSVYARAQLLGLTKPSEPEWTGWEDAQLRAGYAASTPIGQIAALIGRTIGAVYKRAWKFGLEHPLSPVGWSQAECERALELAEQGLQYGFIRQRLADEGFPMRPKSSFQAKIRNLGYGRGWGRPWTAEEDELIRRAYAAGDSLTPLQASLARSRTSIAWRAGELGLQGTHERPNGWRTDPEWTPADEARLRAGYGKTPTRQLAAELGRELRAVYTRANVLGLRHPWMRAFTPDEARLIQIAWRHGVGLRDISLALRRETAVVSKFAIRQGYAFDDPARPAAPSRGGPRKVALTREQILALADPDEPFIPINDRPRGRANPKWGAAA